MKISRNKKGQTVIEFAFVSVLFVFMLVVTVNAIMAFCTQQYISYAVFMAARAYQAGGRAQGDNLNRAVTTLKSYLPGIPNNTQDNLSIPLRLPELRKPVATIRGLRIAPPQQFKYGPAGEIANVGIEVNFDVPFVELPLGPAMRASFGTIKLRASSYLGREVSQTECQAFYPRFLSLFVIDQSDIRQRYERFSEEFGSNMEDNGC